MQNVNVVVLTGNLTRDPKLRSTNGGTKVCNLRIAVNGRRKNSDGEYKDKPNYFRVSIWGARGEACAKILRKGSPIAVEGRLDWSEVDEGDDHREYIQVVANHIQFLGSKPKDEEENNEEVEPSTEDGAGEEPELLAAGAGYPTDDIPL